ncbi:hypothetical protein MKW98_003485 [Papaver atlanticum]|uniref:Germin-like protein n=1 Tax=Papaver atlanticum TaxID=357466 RepID=A0AAD4TB65_9MAGN|nr:hypothetical protein MKW98_003485 [Papaver atlanticum]
MVASDPDMLQDICVADPSSAAKMNGFACKVASTVTAQDFFFTGICQPGNITNVFGSLVTGANVENIPGLNTLGVSLSRIDYLAGGLNPPHTHPRATEIVFAIMKGEVFVFPKGTVHFQKNNGDIPASVIAAFNSQLPGTQSIAMTLFGAKPAVPDNVLAQAFQIDTTEVQTIKSKFAPKM